MSDTDFTPETDPLGYTPVTGPAHAASTDEGKSKGRTLLIAVSVLAGVAILAAATLGYLLTQANSELTSARATIVVVTDERDEAKVGLASASASAVAWEAVADKWRLCSVAALETGQALLRDGIFAAGIPLGETTAKCEDAREADDAASGGFGA